MCEKHFSNTKKIIFAANLPTICMQSMRGPTKNSCHLGVILSGLVQSKSQIAPKLQPDCIQIAGRTNNLNAERKAFMLYNFSSPPFPPTNHNQT